VAGEASRPGRSSQNVGEIVLLRARRCRAVVDQDAVGNSASDRRPGLVVVSVDEAGHDHLAAGVNLGGVSDTQVPTDGLYRLAFDKHVAFDKFSE
jgi:hypothetical protein